VSFAAPSLHRHNRWLSLPNIPYEAIVDHNGERHREGTFDDEVEATKARDRLAIQLHSPFARLNFPPEDTQAEGQ
jgi:hypothetical protein